jgi:hypothetical protein
MRMRRSAAGNWGKVSNAVKALSQLRAMSLGQTSAVTTFSDDEGPISMYE